MAKKTQRIDCNIDLARTHEEVTFIYQEAKGDEWVDVKKAAFDLQAVAGKTYADGDSTTSLAAYGLRAWLADRTSQFRTHGGPAVLDAMDTYYTDCLLADAWSRRRSPRAAQPKVDYALAQVVCDLKGCTMAQATAALAAKPELGEAIKLKYAEEYAAAVAAQADAPDLDDLLTTGEDESEQL